MSDKPEKKPEAAAPAAGADKPAEKPKGGMLTKMPVVLGGVMVLEAVILFAGFKILGSKPQAAPGAEMASTEGEGEKGKSKGDKKTVEVQVVDFKALNRANGRMMLYSTSIFVVTKAENEEKVKDKFKDNKALIEDRIRTIIAESDPEKLDGASEPGLETLRRQVKYQLDGILGDGVIEEVLVPQCIPFRTD